ncbi:MAG: hypothetical protein IPG44_11540 [Anaerolineales bacterium]|nr:hypothetical protein [Anaerolineales bacterium]
MVALFPSGVNAQSQDSAACMERAKTIRARYQPIVDADKNSVWEQYDFLFGRPIFNAKQLAGRWICLSKLRQYIEKLVQAGIVREGPDMYGTGLSCR